jgi:hypothetical protein
LVPAIFRSSGMHSSILIDLQCNYTQQERCVSPMLMPWLITEV